MRKKGNVLNANTGTIKENSKTDPVTYRAGATTGGVRRRLPRGPGHSEDHPNSPRTLRRLGSVPLGARRDKNPEDLSDMRTLRKLPWSIATDGGGVD
jgi:hypothetical protein